MPKGALICPDLAHYSLAAALIPPSSRGAQPAEHELHAALDGMDAAHHRIVSLLKPFFVIACHDVFNKRPKTTLLPVWPRDVKSVGTPAKECVSTDYVWNSVIQTLT